MAAPLVETLLRDLPESPGVYIMKDISGTVIYVGKSKKLKNRVTQYFRSHTHPPKVAAMVANVAEFEYILTDTELEALVLECNLIKKYMPHYNVLLKDDKQYPYIRLQISDPYPWVMMVRKIEKDKARYFGPFLSVTAVFELLEIVQKQFKIRACHKDLSKVPIKDRPCLHYHIKQCFAPCQGLVSLEEYHQQVQEAIVFLGGHYDQIIETMEQKMITYSEELNFELAARYRDRIAAVKRLSNKQKIISTTLEDQDVLHIARQGEDVMIYAFFVRNGKLLGSEKYPMREPVDTTDQEILEAFIEQFYTANTFVPRTVLIPWELENMQVLEQWLCEKRGSRVYLQAPQRGDKKGLLDMVEKNAKEALHKYIIVDAREQERTIGAVQDLQTYLELEKPPMRIECFDISNTMGQESVASMVVFEEGKAAKKEYRRFKIKTVEGPNDFASMQEVVGRRFRRGVAMFAEAVEKGENPREGGFSKLPDLIVVDGGPVQLQYAYDALSEIGLDIPMVSLAEREEEVYRLDSSEPLRIPRHANALHLLQRIRDEAHRFAITYHRSLRGKSSLLSVLDQIPGIGKARRNNLFKIFKSVEKIKAATTEELCAVAGMNKTAAAAIQAFFADKPAGV